MSYTPPNGAAADFSWSGVSAYTAPSGDAADLAFAPDLAQATLLGVGLLGIPRITSLANYRAWLQSPGLLGAPQAQGEVATAAWVQGAGLLGAPQAALQVQTVAWLQAQGLLGAPYTTVEPGHTEVQLQSPGLLGEPLFRAGNAYHAWLQSPRLLGVPALQAHSFPVWLQSPGLLGVPQALADLVYQASADEALGVAAPLRFLVGLQQTGVLTGTVATTGITEQLVPASDLYNTFSSRVVPALELNAQAVQPLSWLSALQAIFPFSAAEPLSLADAPVATLTRVLQATEVLRQLDRLSNTSEQATQLLATLGLDPNVAPILSGSVTEALALQGTVNWALRRELLASEQLRLSSTMLAVTELQATLREVALLNERCRYGLGLSTVQTLLFTPSTLLDAKQILRVLEGLQLRDSALPVLTIASSLQESLRVIDALIFGLGQQLNASALWLDSTSHSATLVQLREIMALGSRSMMTSELFIRLAEVLRTNETNAATLVLLATESLGLVGDALAEVYFGARAAELILLETDPRLAQEVRRSLSEMVVLAETTGFGARWSLVDDLIATIAATPDLLRGLRADETFRTRDALRVVAELTAVLQDRWFAFAASNQLLGLRAETLLSLTELTEPNILRWLRADERVILTERNSALLEVTAQLNNVMALATDAGLVLRWTVTETLSSSDSLPRLVLSVARVRENIVSDDTATLGVEVLVQLVAGVLDIAETVGFVTRLTLAENLLASVLVDYETAAQLLRALEGFSTSDLTNVLLEIDTSLAERWRLAESTGFIARFLAELQFLLTANTSPDVLRRLLVAERLQLQERVYPTAELSARLTELVRTAADAGVRFALTANETTTLGATPGLLLKIAPLTSRLGATDRAIPQVELVVLIAEKILRLAETTSFLARITLAEELIATALLNPDTANILRALEGFTTADVARALTELAPQLVERWRLAERTGMLMRVMLETQWLLNDNAVPDALRWFQANTTLQLSSSNTAALELIARLEAVQRWAETAGLLFSVSTTEGLTLTSTLPPLALRLETLRQTLGVSAVTAVNLELAARLLEALVAMEVAGAVQGMTATEIVALSDQLTEALWSQLTATSTLALVEDVASNLTVVTSEDLALTDSVTSLLELLVQAKTGIAFIGRLPLAEGDYQAWVVNTDTLGVTQYTQFGFNSLVNHKGMALGLTETGLYELVGDTDDGVAIDAVISTGELNLGNLTRKNVPRAYLYLKQDGDLFLRTSAIDSGHRREYLYKIELNSALGDEPTTRRLALGRGLRAVSWAFELHNVDGADFDLRGAEILPVILSLRE